MKLLIIVLGTIFIPLIIHIIIKLLTERPKKIKATIITPTPAKPKTKKSWFAFFFQIVIAGWVCFGIYLFVVWYISPNKQNETTQQLATTEQWDWTFEWEANASHLASDTKQEKGCIHDAHLIFHNDLSLKFKYVKTNDQVVEVNLTRENFNQFYYGRVIQGKLYLRVWLLPDGKGNFAGQFDNGPKTNLIEVFLRKKV